MPLGKVPTLGTEEERAAIRREKVKLNVRAFRQRQLDKQFHAEVIDYALDFAKNRPEIVGRNPCSPQRPIDIPYHRKVESPSVSEKLEQNPDYRERTVRPLVPKQMNEVPLPLDTRRTNRLFYLNIMIGYYLPDMSIWADFHNKLNPTQLTASTVSTCSAFLLSSSAVFDQHGSEVLTDSLLSMALCILGGTQGDRDMQMQGRYAYKRALSRIRKMLDRTVSAANPDQTAESHHLLAFSCLICALSEYITNNSIPSYFKHLDGVALLIERSGPSSMDSEMARALFFEHRAMYIGKCCYERRSCFYSTKNWIDVPWKADSQLATSPLHTLLNIAYQIPELQEAFDRRSPTTRTKGFLQQILRTTHKLEQTLEAWRETVSRSIVQPSLKVEHDDSSNMPELFSNSIYYASFPIAFTLMYYYAFKLCLADMVLDVADSMTMNGEDGMSLMYGVTSTYLDMAGRICRSLKYCFDPERKIGGKLIGVFPFHTARHAFTRISQQSQCFHLTAEIEWCRKTAEKFREFGIAPLPFGPEYEHGFIPTVCPTVSTTPCEY